MFWKIIVCGKASDDGGQRRGAGGGGVNYCRRQKLKQCESIRVLFFNWRMQTRSTKTKEREYMTKTIGFDSTI